MGQQDKPAGHWTRSRVTRESWSTSLAFGLERRSPGRAGRYLRPSDLGVIRPGVLVDPAGRRTRARVARESWPKPRALRTGPEWPGRAGRPRGPSDPGARRPGQLVDATDTPTRSRVARESWSTRRALGSTPMSSWNVGRAREISVMCQSYPGHRSTPRPSDLGASCPGQLVNPKGSRTRA